MFKFQKGTKYQQRGREVLQHLQVILEAKQGLINCSVLALRATVLTRVGTAPRGTGSFGNWTTHKQRSHCLTYSAPALYHYLQEPYASNFLRYCQLLHYTSVRNLTYLDILKVESLAAAFVDDYERLYYSGDSELLPSCTIQFHYLLHLRQNIRDFGPLLCFAQQSLERFLCTVRRFSTATAYKHQSAEINLLSREQRLHAQWQFKGQYLTTLDNSLLYADNFRLLFFNCLVGLQRRWNSGGNASFKRQITPWHPGTLGPIRLIQLYTVVLSYYLVRGLERFRLPTKDLC